MKDLKSMFDALLAGDTLISLDLNVEMNITSSGELVGINDYLLLIPSFWEIKEKPPEKHWYDSLINNTDKSKGVLCWCNDIDDTETEYNESIISFVYKYSPIYESSFPFDSLDQSFINAVPLTSKEIQKYLDAAQDIERGVF